MMSEAWARQYVVVGASGVLAPLAGLLAGPGVQRVGVARGRTRWAGDWDARREADGHDSGQVAALIATLGAGYDLVAYGPCVTPETWMILCRNATRRVILLTSAAARPGAALERWTASGDVTICSLGWSGPPGCARWHTAHEISIAAREALALPAGSRVTLGRLRPWSERP